MEFGEEISTVNDDIPGGLRCKHDDCRSNHSLSQSWYAEEINDRDMSISRLIGRKLAGDLKELLASKTLRRISGAVMKAFQYIPRLVDFALAYNCNM